MNEWMNDYRSPFWMIFKWKAGEACALLCWWLRHNSPPDTGDANSSLGPSLLCTYGSLGSIRGLVVNTGHSAHWKNMEHPYLHLAKETFFSPLLLHPHQGLILWVNQHSRCGKAQSDETDHGEVCMEASITLQCGPSSGLDSPHWTTTDCSAFPSLWFLSAFPRVGPSLRTVRLA